MDNKFNYYDILEVHTQSAQPDITAAYERAKATYSGENPALYTVFSEEEARELLKLVEEAFSVLGNKTLRNLYDQKLAQGIQDIKGLSFSSLNSESKVQYAPPPPSKSAYKSVYTANPEFEEEMKSCTEWTGEFLKKIREYKNISIESMSETTKISAYYISSLENMDPSGLPAAVFVRGYVGQVAKVLGLEERKVCDSYMKIFKTKT